MFVSQNHVSRCVQQLHEGQATAATNDRLVQRQLAEISKSLQDTAEQFRSNLVSLKAEITRDYVSRSEHQELKQKYEMAEFKHERERQEHRELTTQRNLAVQNAKKLEDKIKQLEQEKETLWLQANPDEFS